MNSLAFQFLILTWLNAVISFDNEEFMTHLCAADENNMETIYETCEEVLMYAVSLFLINLA